MDCVSISVARTQRRPDCRPVRIDFACGGGLDSQLQRFRENPGDQLDPFATVDFLLSFLFSFTMVVLCWESKFLQELFRGTFGCPISHGASVLQIAVFVDAGYLYAQGSALIAGQKQPRTAIELDVQNVLSEFCKAAKTACPKGRMLRTYWYDGLLRWGPPNSEQIEVANAPLTKLRLGMVNSRGEQKGVDSLIVTDLIDLARNRVITDALILSGDEDIRIGVQMAQTFGVQVHLLGIKPARGSQSTDLIMEADTHREWAEDEVRNFLVVQRSPTEVGFTSEVNVAGTASGFAAEAVQLKEVEREEIENMIARLDTTKRASVRAAAKATPGKVPPELDRPTLAKIRNRISRDLTDEERKAYREEFTRRLSN